MPTAYKQWVLPKFSSALGTLEVRINVKSVQPDLGVSRGAWSSTFGYVTDDTVWYGTKQWRALQTNTNHIPAENAYWTAATNFDFKQDNPAFVLYLDSRYQIMKLDGISPLKKHISREEGQLTPDTRTLTFIDFLQYSGTTGDGTAVSEDLTLTTHKTLLNRIFDDATAQYTVFMSLVLAPTNGVWDPLSPSPYTDGQIVSYTDPATGSTDSWLAVSPTTPGSPPSDSDSHWLRARQTYFIGDIKFKNTTKDHTLLFKPGTADALQHQRYVLQADACSARVNAFKVKDLLPLFSTSDFVNSIVNDGRLPVYAGFAIKSGEKIPGDYKLNELSLGHWTRDGSGRKENQSVMLAAHSVNMNFHFVNFKTIVSKICTLCNFYFAGTDASTVSKFKAYVDKVETVANTISGVPADYLKTVPTEITGTNAFENIAVCYEYTFGSDPRCNLNKVQITSPVTFDWETPIADVLRKIAYFFGCYPDLSPVDRTGIMELKLLDRFTSTTNALPSNWKRTKESSVSQRVMSSTHVEVSNTGDSDKLACPTKRNEATNVEIGWRTKLRARGAYAAPDDLIYNSSISQENQSTCWNALNGYYTEGTDATVTFVDPGGTYAEYSLESLSSEFANVRTSPVPDTFLGLSDKSEIQAAIFQNGAIGYITDIVNRNKVHLWFDKTQTAPPTGTNIPFAIGFTGWLTDISVTYNSDEIGSTADFSGRDPYGRVFVGQQIIMPDYGAYRIDRWGTAGDPTNIHKATLSAIIDGPTATGVVGKFGGPEINPDGWHLGAYIFYYESNPSAKYFPDNDSSSGYLGWYESPGYSYGVDGTDWSGMYTISRWKYNSTGDPGINYGNTLYSSAQVYALLNVGNFTQLKVKFKGGLSDSGQFDYRLLDTYQDYIDGDYRTFVAIGYEIDEMKGTVTVDFLEDVALDPSTLSVWKIKGNGSSGGAASVGGSGSGVSGGGSGGGSSSGSTNTTAVLVAPSTVHRNKITPSLGVVALELQSAPGASDNLLNAFASDGTTSLASLDYQGNLAITGNAAITGTLGVTSNASVGGSLSITGKGTSALTSGGDPSNTLVTKSYVDAGIVTFETDGTPNSDQTLLNLKSGYNMTLTESAGDVTISGPAIIGGTGINVSNGFSIILGTDTATVSNAGVSNTQTDGVDNGDQTHLNLVSGTGISLTEDGFGNVTIDASTVGVDLQTNSVSNSDQTVLNLKDGTGVAITSGVGGAVTVSGTHLQTNGVDNGAPRLLNLKDGTGITVTDDGVGGITVASTVTSGVTSVDVSGGTTGLTTSGGPITSTGTITFAGTVNATHGGTGQTSYTSGDILYANSTTTLAKLPVGSGHAVLQGGVSPSWVESPSFGNTVTLYPTVAATKTSIVFTDATSGSTLEMALNPSTLSGTRTITLPDKSGVLAITDPTGGGTGQTSYTTGDIIYASASNTLSKRAIGSTSQALIVSGGVPTWGTVPVAGGGTGQTTYTNGQLLIGNTTGNTLTKATLTAGTNISITNGAGSITITNTAGGTAGTGTQQNLSGVAASNTTDAMQGLAGSFTPTASGTALVILSGSFLPSTAADITSQLRYGTGSAPAHGDPVTGTTVGPQLLAHPTANTMIMPFTNSAVITGLTPGTTYWVDISTSASAGNVRLQPGNGNPGVSLSIMEAPIGPVGASVQSSPSNPTGVSGAGSQAMQGLAGSITPASSGRLYVVVSGSGTASSNTSGGTVEIRYGTGTAPANGATVTGTSAGNGQKYTLAGGLQVFPFCVHGVVTGLTTGTAYWLDLALTSSLFTATLSNISISAIEF